MTKQVLWVSATLEAFIKEGNLNERQEYIVRSRAKGDTIVHQAYELNLSVDQVNKEIAKLKKIYDETQKYSSILPKRAKNLAELVR